MGEFIEVDVDSSKCTGIKACGGCVRVCPVNIFDSEGDRPSIVAENEDECTLCDLCTQVCTPAAITIHKRYEDRQGTSA